MSRSTVVRLPHREAPDGSTYTVRLTDSGIARDLLCLEYLVFPVPPVLAGGRDLHDGAAAGLAVVGHDVHRRCVRTCARSAWSSRADGCAGPASARCDRCSGHPKREHILTFAVLRSREVITYRRPQFTRSFRT